MRGSWVKESLTTGRWTLLVCVLGCLLSWTAACFMPLPTTETSPSILWAELSLHTASPLLKLIVGYLIYALIGYALIELNNRFSLIRVRTSVQTVLYLLLVTACPLCYPLEAGDAIALSGLLALFFLFQSYQQPEQAPGHLHTAFLFIGLASLLFPKFIYLVPLLLWEAYRFQSLTPRSFFAALLGWMLPHWLLLAHQLFYQDYTLLEAGYQQWNQWESLFAWSSLPPWQIAWWTYLLILFCISTGHYVLTGFQDKIRTRAYLNVCIDLSLFLFILAALQPQYAGLLLPLALIGVSILGGRLFVVSKGRVAEIFFLAALIFPIVLYMYQLWNLR